MSFFFSAFGLVEQNEQTVETITASLNKMVNDLQVHADTHLTKSNEALVESQRLVEVHEAHKTEAVRAKEVATKISNLLS